MFGDRTTLYIYVTLVSSPCAVAIRSVAYARYYWCSRCVLGWARAYHSIAGVRSMRSELAYLRTTVCTRFDFYPRTLEQLSHVHWPSCNPRRCHVCTAISCRWTMDECTVVTCCPLNEYTMLHTLRASMVPCFVCPVEALHFRVQYSPCQNNHL